VKAAIPATISVRNASIRFGGLQALNDVSLEMRGGDVLAIIGPNGAGKTTFVNCLSGLVDMDTGEVSIDGVVAKRPILPKLVDFGISRTFQNIRLFPNLTVREHIALARESYMRSERARARTDMASRPLDAVCDELLSRMGLATKAGYWPRELSYGERRKLEIARALAIEPKLLLLDEPAAGMVPSEQKELAVMIRDIAGSGIAVILIEHHMDLVGSVAGKVMVLNFGCLIVEGTIDVVRDHPEVISAYLGSTASQ